MSEKEELDAYLKFLVDTINNIVETIKENNKKSDLDARNK